MLHKKGIWIFLESFLWSTCLKLEFIFQLKKIFICFWLLWVFVALGGLSLVMTSGGYFIVAVWELLIAVAPLVAEHGLEGAQRTWAQ